jgi:ATP-dependent DNA helicase RecG
MLTIIDEQHRFGVEQRGALVAKGDHVDVLVMTATPIPRTLLISQFGDMDASILDEKPIGRKETITRLVGMARLEELLAGLQRVIDTGQRVYWDLQIGKLTVYEE